MVEQYVLQSQSSDLHFLDEKYYLLLRMLEIIVALQMTN